MPEYEDDGRCLATNDQALQTVTDIGQVKGDWWVLKGRNCGLDDIWPGGYDWYPCQHSPLESQFYKQLQNYVIFIGNNYCIVKLLLHLCLLWDFYIQLNIYPFRKQ